MPPQIPALPPAPLAALASEESGGLSPLIDRLRELDHDALRALEHGLQGLAAGDFSQPRHSDVRPLLIDPEDAELRALVDLLNGMIVRIHSSMEAYEVLRGDLMVALGDRSGLPELLLALRSLNAHCLTDLDTGWQAIADGDLTRSARPVTRPLRPGLRSLPRHCLRDLEEGLEAVPLGHGAHPPNRAGHRAHSHRP